MAHGHLVKGSEIAFRHGDKILVGWVESNLPVYDKAENVVGYVVSCPEFQGIVHTDNIINKEQSA
jgi:hypothetical protein